MWKRKNTALCPSTVLLSKPSSLVSVAPRLLESPLMTFPPVNMVTSEVKVGSKRYPEKFKIEAFRQLTNRGYSVTDVDSRKNLSLFGKID